MAASDNRKTITFIMRAEKRWSGTEYLTLHSLFKRIETVNDVADLKARTFHDTKVFVIQAEKINDDFREFVKLRKRFSKRPFILHWFGKEEEITSAVGLLDAPGLIALKDEKVDQKALFELIEALAARKYEVPPRVEMISVSELADRIDGTADAIADLRLNSTGHVVEELRQVSKSLRSKFRDSDESTTVIDPRSKLKKILEAIAMVFDAVESSKTASMIVSGVVSYLVGGGGWSSTACLSLTMASWYGKDAFLAAVNNLPSADPGGKRKALTKWAGRRPPIN